MGASSTLDSSEIIFIADIGTTTIKASLCMGGKSTSFSEKNAQTVFGLDVISRVLYAHHNGVAPLQEKIRSQLQSMLTALCTSAGIQSETVNRSIITGNTVMLHLLRGLSVEGFEMAPFTPVTLDAAEEVLLGKPVYYPPCIDAFIGADAVCAALYALSASKTRICASGEKKTACRSPLLLADVGTNTEIMLIQMDEASENFTVTCCSTAAGPAFEGGVSGGRQEGSRLVHMLAELLKNGTMDETGLFTEQTVDASVSESGCTLTQDDIRKLQLAKGAVCAAIDTLLLEAGVSVHDVGFFVLCGNFGSALNAEEAEYIGLFPEGLARVTQYADNAAEQGAQLLVRDEMKTLAKKIAASGKLIQLADSRFFARRYIERMNFISQFVTL